MKINHIIYFNYNIPYDIKFGKEHLYNEYFEYNITLLHLAQVFSSLVHYPYLSYLIFSLLAFSIWVAYVLVSYWSIYIVAFPFLYF